MRNSPLVACPSNAGPAHFLFLHGLSSRKGGQPAPAQAISAPASLLFAAMEGKGSTFKDRRFGESNPSLSAEAKRLARFQKERSRQLRRAAKFNLEAEAAAGGSLGGQDVLTHGGAVRPPWCLELRCLSPHSTCPLCRN